MMANKDGLYLAVPDGYMMVPVEPTTAMLAAASKYADLCAIENYGGCADPAGIWHAMLSASNAAQQEV